MESREYISQDFSSRESTGARRERGEGRRERGRERGEGGRGDGGEGEGRGEGRGGRQERRGRGEGGKTVTLTVTAKFIVCNLSQN